MLGEIRVRDLRTGLEHADLQASFRKLPSGHAAGCARTDDDGIVVVAAPRDRLQHPD